ncbi:L,D-transpeptidase family protein [Streptomyces glomeratus]|uniref:Lipoprotein n=1 Tax=Streptomyces glomeratus TaxID=284452 RepID=A0ABP6LP73_9ACTN
MPSSDEQSAGRTFPDQADPSPPATSDPTADPGRVPGVGARLHRLIPEASRQVLAVYGEGEDSPDCTLVLYEKDDDDAWYEAGQWQGHNGRKGWTTDHHENDLRTPVGVFTLSDAGGTLDDPGARLPYDQGKSYRVPQSWGEAHLHDFDYVIAIDYNRLRGTPPTDPTRPEGDKRGGGIWLHVDHGDGTSGCVTLPESGMEYLLRTLDPDRHPVVVMGDRQALKA